MSFNGLLQLAIGITASGESQNFLGASWVSGVLGVAPATWKRPLALRFLAVSPHYFYRSEANARLSNHDFLASEYRRNRETRQLIIDGLIARHARPDFVCLDYGCGPGFLAVAAAPKVARVIACDISGGVLACAGIINPAPDVEYRKVERDGKIPAKDESVDLIYSFAVVQHVTDEVLESILAEFKRVLKLGGIAVCHVVLNEEGLRSETDWRTDRTFRGRIKWKIGLHCFSRSPTGFEALVKNAGLKLRQVIAISGLGVDLAQDDIENDYLCILNR
jgi:SAM-dependent methyltransferase